MPVLRCSGWESWKQVPVWTSPMTVNFWPVNTALGTCSQHSSNWKRYRKSHLFLWWFWHVASCHQARCHVPGRSSQMHKHGAPHGGGFGANGRGEKKENLLLLTVRFLGSQCKGIWCIHYCYWTSYWRSLQCDMARKRNITYMNLKGTIKLSIFVDDIIDYRGKKRNLRGYLPETLIMLYHLLKAIKYCNDLRASLSERY